MMLPMMVLTMTLAMGMTTTTIVMTTWITRMMLIIMIDVSCNNDDTQHD